MVFNANVNIISVDGKWRSKNNSLHKISYKCISPKKFTVKQSIGDDS